jgi:hypothetical protein
MFSRYVPVSSLQISRLRGTVCSAFLRSPGTFTQPVVTLMFLKHAQAFMIAVSALLSVLSDRTRADEPQRPSITIVPPVISLTDARDWQRLLVLRTLPDGSTSDVTASATFSLSDPAICQLELGQVRPLSDGRCQITVRYEDSETTAMVEVTNAATVPDLQFRTEVLAVLTKSGCNSGKCHGAASGKDGFRLSLFGYDPPGDHHRLTREFPGRRVNVNAPDSSLLLQKALGNVNHTGGQCLEEDSEHFQTLQSWIATGAPADPPEAAIPTGIRVYPDEAVFASHEAGPQPLLVIASFSDGTDRDVTDLCVFLSNNDAVSTVNNNGTIAPEGPGTSFILARFDQFTEGTDVIVRPGTPFRFPEMTPNNQIDSLVFERWKNLHLLPSDVCSDEEFLRRAQLDLIGLLPTPAERDSFLADPDPNKRAKHIDALLQRPEFLDLWVMKWAELLQIRTVNGLSPKGLLMYDRWLRERVHAGQTIDQIIRELIPATGGTFENPATSYYQTETTPQLLAENIAQSFMGTRIQCAQCHNHPFDRWTMDDYYGFASFFSQVGYKQAQDPREILVFNAGTGSLKHPIADRSVVPAFLGAGPAVLTPGIDYRAILADWLASDVNPAFSQNLGNIVWAHFFGLGIVEPVDDVRVSNPPSNPQLLNYLGKKLVQDRYDIRPLIREICLSRTWQLSSTRNDSNRLDERHFSHSKVRRMRAEVLLDCLNQVTESQEEFRGLPRGSRAVQIADGQTPNYFLTTFGRASRATACSCEVRTSPTLSQALHLINGESTTGKIDSGAVIDRLMLDSANPLDVATRLFERCLCRQPTEQELQHIKARLTENQDAREALRDLFWALLNSNEFLFNH